MYGRSVYGFCREGQKLVPNERELGVVRRIHAARRRGHGFRAIAAALNRERVPTKEDRTWHASTVRYVLKNDLYAPFLAEYTLADDEVSFGAMRRKRLRLGKK